MSVKVTNSLNVLLGSNPDVGGASIGYIDNYEVSSVNVGYARVSSGETIYEDCVSPSWLALQLPQSIGIELSLCLHDIRAF